MNSVSIVIRCLNEEKHIGRLLAGIMNQTRAPDEIVLVDSGSTDTTLQIAAQFPVRILSLPEEEFSFGRSLNFGLSGCVCDLVVIASAHVYPIYETWLEKLLTPFSDERVALSYGRQQGDERTKFSEHQILRRWFPNESQWHQDHPFCNNANAAVRRDVWEKLPYNESLTGLEDLDWAKRALEAGFRLAYVADAAVVHVHDEAWVQIFNRYKREAIAHRQIYGEQSMGAIESIGLAALNVASDYFTALRAGVLSQNLRGIPLFRLAQFLGTYQGFRHRGPISATLKKRFYYPNAFSPGVSPNTSASARPIRYKSSANDHVTYPPVIDISVPLEEGMTTWPGSGGYRLSATLRLEAGDVANVSKIEMDVHSGTHVDAPLHCLTRGAPVNELPLDPFIGPAYVVDFHNAKGITAELLAHSVPAGTKRLLCRTSNSAHWNEKFRDDFVAFTRDGAQWLVDNQVRLVANDYLSIQRYNDTPETHGILMQGGVMIVEGVNLKDVPAGPYTLVCLPLQLVGAEGAPARAVLLPAGRLPSS